MNERDQTSGGRRGGRDILPSAAALARQSEFEILWSAHRRQVERWARGHCDRLGLPREEAADIAQDVSLDLLTALRNGNSPARPAGFLKQITACRAIDRYRYRQVRAETEEVDEERWPDEDWAQPLVDSLRSRDPRTDPAAAAVAAAFKGDLLDLLAELPELPAQAFILVDLRGASYRDAAAALQAPEGTVKTWVRAARQQLKRKLPTRGWTSE